MSPRLTGDEAALWQAAVRVLDANWTGAATVPSPGLYPHQWSWDSAFISIGLGHHRRARAARELLSVFRGQWSNGLVPHIVFNSTLPRNGYYPGPELWRSNQQPAAPAGVDTSGLTQPPLHALAALRLFTSGGPGSAEAFRPFLKRIYPLLTAQHAYLARDRDIGGAGLVSVCHPWESGLENSPAWDRPLAALQPPRPTFRRTPPDPSNPSDKQTPSDRQPQDRRPPADRRVPFDRKIPPDTDPERHAWLATLVRDAGYRREYLHDEHPFAVEDPLFNAVFLASTHALVELALIIGADPAPHLDAAARIHEGLLNRLWDGRTGCFRARDLRSGTLIPVVTVASFAPLLDPELPSAIVRSVVELMLSPRFAGASGYPVPSCDIQSAMFDRAGYWRGSSWVSTNWLLWLGAVTQGVPVVADLLAGSSLRLVRQSGFREYFDPFDGSGRGSHDFSCSAALILDLLATRRLKT